MGESKLTTHVYGASITAAISDIDNSIKWVYNNYINIFYRTKTKDYFFDFFFFEEHSCPFLIFNTVPRTTIQSSYKEVIDFLCKSLDDEHYIGIVLDKYYLSCSPYYLSTHYYHPVFIYGYDSNLLVFYGCDHNRDNKFEHFMLSFDEVEKSYWSLMNPSIYKSRVNLFTKLANVEYDLDLRMIKNAISAFINSEATPKYYTTSGHIFGSNAVLHLADSILLADEYIDARPFHLLWDQKKLMKERLEYFEKNKFIDKGKNFSTIYDYFSNEYLKLRNMSLKYNIIKSERILAKMNSNLLLLTASELQVLKEIEANIYT